MPTPKEYLENVGEQRILERVYIYEQIYNLHIRDNWFAAHLSLEVLRHIVDNYFVDVERTKDFHAAERVNRHRQAAFTLKWVSKFRPIQLTVGHSISGASMFINEVYAIHLAMYYLKKPLKGLPLPLVDDLLYDLHFRPIDGEILTLVMRAIDASMPGGK